MKELEDALVVAGVEAGAAAAAAPPAAALSAEASAVVGSTASVLSAGSAAAVLVAALPDAGSAAVPLAAPLYIIMPTAPCQPRALLENNVARRNSRCGGGGGGRAGALHERVELHAVGDGAVWLCGARAGRGDGGGEAERDVPGLVAAELGEVGRGELAVEEPVELGVARGGLAVGDLEAVGLSRRRGFV